MEFRQNTFNEIIKVYYSHNQLFKLISSSLAIRRIHITGNICPLKVRYITVGFIEFLVLTEIQVLLKYLLQISSESCGLLLNTNTLFP